MLRYLINLSGHRSVQASIRAIVTHAVVLTIGVAGVLKFADLAEFTRAVGTWELVPVWARGMLVFGVPAFEIFCAAGWILGTQRRNMRLLLIGMLIAFTLAFVSHLLWAHPPDCGCFGKDTVLQAATSRRCVLAGRKRISHSRSMGVSGGNARSHESTARI